MPMRHGQNFYNRKSIGYDYIKSKYFSFLSQNMQCVSETYRQLPYYFSRFLLLVRYFSFFVLPNGNQCQYHLLNCVKVVDCPLAFSLCCSAGGQGLSRLPWRRTDCGQREMEQSFERDTSGYYSERKYNGQISSEKRLYLSNFNCNAKLLSLITRRN